MHPSTLTLIRWLVMDASFKKEQQSEPVHIPFSSSNCLQMLLEEQFKGDKRIFFEQLNNNTVLRDDMLNGELSSSLKPPTLRSEDWHVSFSIIGGVITSVLANVLILIIL